MTGDWTANIRMEELLERASALSRESSLNTDTEQLDKLFFPPFKQLRDCVIISDKPVNILEDFFDKAIKLYGDKTGYESSCGETRINCYFRNNISVLVEIKIAMMVLKIWGLQLKKLEPQSNFCMIMCCDECNVEIRFHKIHIGEKMWLDNNLEKYTHEAVGYMII